MKIEEKAWEKKHWQDVITAIDRILADVGKDETSRSLWLGLKEYITTHYIEDNKEA